MIAGTKRFYQRIENQILAISDEDRADHPDICGRAEIVFKRGDRVSSKYAVSFFTKTVESETGLDD
jgi:hypothetical protein